LAGIMAAASPAVAAPALQRNIYADKIVMFGAHWCAPCMVESRRLPELTAAAAPDRILLAWIDHPIAPLPTAMDLASLAPDVARRLARNLEGDGYGLPFSVMFDSHGEACSVRRSPLSPEDIVRMRLQCATSK